MTTGGALWKELDVISQDGTRIHVYVAGKAGKTLFFAPGLGGPIESWDGIAQAFCKEYQIVSWDARGTYKSEKPKDEENCLIPHHVMDMEAIAQALALEKVVVGGWSMGVEVAIEFTSRHKDWVSGLILIGGTYGRLLDSMLGVELPDKVIAMITSGLSALGMPASLLLKTLLNNNPSVLRLLRSVGFVKHNESSFAVLAQRFASLDFRYYFKLVRGLATHNSKALLPSINVPTLVIAGEKDRITPLSVMQEIANKIPSSRLVVLPEATHYAIVEYPEIVISAVGAFLASLERKSPGIAPIDLLR
jgi:pimeloyl-ACP methyl ester carboxylesterase